MRLALVIPAGQAQPSASLDSILREAREFTLQLRGRVELELFSERRGPSPLEAGHELSALGELDPKRFDRILYSIGDDPGCAFMLPMLRRVGGIVLLLDWGLGRVARRCWPELDRPGLRGYARALAVGGLVGARERLRAQPALNRPVVRFADGFIVRSPELRERILVERNMPTPIACVDEGERAKVGTELGQHYAQMLERFPAHAAVRPSLIQSAIEGADRARRERAAERRESD